MNAFAERRRHLMEQLGSGVAVFPAAPVALRNNDVEHDYRQDSDFYYLSGFDEPESVLVLANNHPEHKMVLFVRPRDPEREVWDGKRFGVDGAVREFGADAAFPISELATRLPDYLQDHDKLLYRIGRDRVFDEKLLAGLDATRLRGRRGASWPQQIIDPAALLHEMRLFKSPDEIATMRRAASITRDAHVAAMKEAKPGRYEYEIDALIGQVFRRQGSQRVAYSSIVGSGPNATVLHYRSNNRRMQDGDLLLVDAGCELDYYASDVTRTYPVSGQFNAAQRAIYQIVLDAQVAAIEATRPGATLVEIHMCAVHVIVDGLLRLGLLQGEHDAIVSEGTYRAFYMHRTSHFLGMDVHDVGAYYQAKVARKLEPGMVITVEPGIYIGDSNPAVAPEFHNIGVRIEDDVLVTADGCLNLTADIPKTVGELESVCSA